MALASAILDSAQTYLHDDGTLWTRTELLGYLNHGYMRLLTETDAVRRLAAYETPARNHWAITYPWERQGVRDFYREWALDAEIQSGYRVAFQWEAEQLQGATPVDSLTTCTQAWERIYAGMQVEKNDRYTYPDDILSTYRITYNGIRIQPTSIRELDEYTSRWDKTAGRPFWYTPGLGRQREFEVWPQVLSYTQAAAFKGFLGTVRRAGEYTVSSSGSGRTIDGRSLVSRGLAAMGAWGKRLLTRGLLGISTTTTYTPDTSYPNGGRGTIRRFAGDVQHICENMDWPGSPPVGVPRRWTGSTESLLIDYSIHAPTLTEELSPDLVPPQFAKYLRWYIIAKALSREGEGSNPKLSAHYEQKYQMGIALLHRMGLLATSARTYQNLPQELRSVRPMRPRLPADYPRIR